MHDCFVRSLTKLYFCFLMDGTIIDSGKEEDELVIHVLPARCCSQGDQELHQIYLSVVTPNKADADGLVNCLRKALQTLKIDDLLDRDAVLSAKPVLI